MTEFSSEHLLTEVPRRNRKVRIKPVAMVLVPLAAILFQVYLPRFFQYLSYLELPLLVTVYYALMRRQPIPGLIFGALVGLGQDSLSEQPLGMFGIVKTLVGYFAASVSMRFDVDNPLIQFLLGFFFFFFPRVLPLGPCPGSSRASYRLQSPGDLSVWTTECCSGAAVIHASR